MLVDYAPTDMPAAPEQTISWKARTNHQLPLYRASIRPLALLHLTTSERLPVSTPELPPLTVLCAIARPERFIQMTQALGYPIESIHTFPDHHAYSRDELQTFAGKTILTTAKDAVKLRALLPRLPTPTPCCWKRNWTLGLLNASYRKLHAEPRI